VTAGGRLTGPAILPVAMRRPAGVVAVLAILVFGALAARYAGGSTARWLDRLVQFAVSSSVEAHEMPDIVVALGERLPVVVLALVLSGLAMALGHRRLAVLAIVGPGLTGLATELSKPLIGRTIGGEFAFPSGHTGGATALGIVAALLLVGVVHAAPPTSAALLTIGAWLCGGTMAFALVAEHAHYATDTVGGFCVAVALVLVSALAIERWAERTSVGRA
jgi:membrane-associated phospholipid phosphatase